MFARTATKALIATAAALVATTAFASPAPAQALTRTVSYSDLDLASAAGRDALDDRLNVAAREVCWAAVSEKIVTHQRWGECRARSFDDARKVAVTVLAARAGGATLASAGGISVSVGNR